MSVLNLSTKVLYWTVIIPTFIPAAEFMFISGAADKFSNITVFLLL